MELSSWARVGAKCVCVDASCAPGREWGHPGEELVEGETLTISDIWVHDGEVVCDFVEKKRSKGAARFYGVDKAGYRLARFRPIVTKTQEQDVAMFKSLLTPAPELVE